MCLFKGSGVALVTPFDNGVVNYNKLEELLKYHIDNKTDAIIICGTTGESATLSDTEKKEVIKFAIEKINKRIPVIAGTGSNDTRHSIELSKYAESVGADGLLLVTPYYNKATQKGLIEHYKAIANSVNIPVILYNVPGRTGVNIEPKTVKVLSEINNIVAIKEASGNIAQIAEIARICNKDFYIYSGNDDMIVPTLSLGGMGVISVVANILPKETHNIVDFYLNGRIEESRTLQLQMLQIINKLFIEVNPIPIKSAMNLIGMNVGKLRLPLTEIEKNNEKLLIEALKEYGLELRG